MTYGTFALSRSLLLGLGTLACASLEASSSTEGRPPLENMAGCFEVHYQFQEKEAFKAGYKVDKRTYDVTIREYIVALTDTQDHVRLQHILFKADETGDLKFIMKHYAENWTFAKPFHYNYRGNKMWEPQQLAPHKGWTREITDLDDGPRYDCTGLWQQDNGQAQWSCDTFAPIPGRETRDMGRHDYNTLQRSSIIFSDGQGWQEDQANIKTIFADGEKIPLASEEGGIAFHRLSDDACQSAKTWAEERYDFWALTREVWAEFLDGEQSFKLRATAPPLYPQVWQLEAAYYQEKKHLSGSIDERTTAVQVLQDSYKGKLRALIGGAQH